MKVSKVSISCNSSPNNLISSVETDVNLHVEYDYLYLKTKSPGYNYMCIFTPQESYKWMENIRNKVFVFR